MHRKTTIALVCLCVPLSLAKADPCGMVPPIYIGDETPIARVGDQNTFVFFKDGVETFVIRPGFTGKVEEFGMLIPFPTPPAIRKMPDSIFSHVRAAIDPPEVIVYRNVYRNKANGNQSTSPASGASDAFGLTIQKDVVRVLREEAVGMYEVAVLEAGSAAALKRWMTEHNYKYPDGMDKVADDYVEDGWCFVAVKTKVGEKTGVDPKPGLRKVNAKLPAGSSFDGHVQAMGFRFKTNELVVPMRLSAFNEGDLHNIVYLLTDGPRRIRSIPEEYVVRQIGGDQLFRNVTAPLPLRIMGGTEADIPPWRRKNLANERNPVPHNGHARDLYAGDLLALKHKRLSNPHEEAEKMLLRIGERLGLRGPDIDKRNLAVLKVQREQARQQALADLKAMTLTVIDGDFPREVLSSKNLAFAEYRMPGRRNKAQFYDAKTKKPAVRRQGVLKLGAIGPPTAPPSSGSSAGEWFLVSLVGIGLAWAACRKRLPKASASLV